MNKQSFMNQLKSSLDFLSPKELKEIVAEFEEHFEVGQEKGYTEQQLVDQLGDPSKIAEEYKSAMLKNAGLDEEIPHEKPQPEPAKTTSQSGSSNHVSIHEKYSPDQVTSIEVQTVSSDIRFRSGNGDIEVDIEGDTNSDIGVMFGGIGTTFSNGKLTIYQRAKWFNLFHWFRKEPSFSITVPKSLLCDLSIETVSGGVTLPHFKGEKINIQGVSGSMHLGDIYGEKIQATTVSGNLSLDKYQGDSLKINTTSGNLKLSSIATSTITIKTVSGDIKQPSGIWDTTALKVETVSGDMEAALSDHWKKMTFNTMSGDIELILPAESNPFDVNLESMSGKEKNALGAIRGAKRIIKANTMSGDLVISKG